MAEKKQPVNKDETFWKVLNAAIELDIRKGHQKWTMSDLSRKSGVTRSLIYYYFGRAKMGILGEAVKVIGEEFAGLSEERMKMWEQGQLFESMLKTREIYNKAPFIGLFLLEHIKKDNEVGQELREIEQSFKKKIDSFFPGMTGDQLDALYAVYWGMSFVPEISENSIQIVVEIIKKIRGQK